MTHPEKQSIELSLGLGRRCARMLSVSNCISTTRALLIIAFLFLTAPVAAHVIARAAYATGVKLWYASLYDQLGDDRAEEEG
jgi:multicomponent Na+:H+ antiporter subunit G